ncbi:MAG: hypothetical protein HOV94_39115 [Saccharothrix sp.]|nr:hypothetical protein [Saccharothrix sp.]
MTDDAATTGPQPPADQTAPTGTTPSGEALTSDNPTDTAGDTGPTCLFPAGPDELCGRPVPVDPAKPGRKPSYCDLPDHTRAKAFAARRMFGQVAGGIDPQRAVALVAEQVVDPDRPVSDGKVRFGALLEQARLLGGELLGEFDTRYTRLTSALDRLATIAAGVVDEDAADFEVQQRRREMEMAVATAESAQAAAEKAARTARQEADKEKELREQADAAAEDALADVERIQAETQAEIDEFRRRMEDAENAATTARQERDNAVEESNLAKAAAVKAKEDFDAEVEEIRNADTDARNRFVSEHLADKQAQIDKAKKEAADEAAARIAAAQAEANKQVEAMRAELEQAKQQAEADRQAKAVAEGAAKLAGEQVERLDADLRQLKVDLEAERATVQELRDKLEGQRTEYENQLRELRGKLDQAHADHTAAVEKMRTEATTERTRIDGQHAAQVEGYQQQVRQLTEQVERLQQQVLALTARLAAPADAQQPNDDAGADRDQSGR